MSKLVEIRPGMNVNIIAHVDINEEKTDVINAIVYDVDDVRIILSQTTPPLPEFYIGKEITVTYLARKEDELSRIGFTGEIIKVLNDYQLYSSQTVQAISVLRQGGFKAYDLRMHYRVKPKWDSGVDIYLEGEKVNIIDISMGGARICHVKKNPIKTGTAIAISLSIDRQKFVMEATALDVWYPHESDRKTDLEYITVQFQKLDKQCSHLLSGKLLAIQRELLSKT